MIPEELRAEDFTCFVNPGPFTLGGLPQTVGVTGRKSLDTYGELRARGGAFSGKDPTKWTAPLPTQLGG